MSIDVDVLVYNHDELFEALVNYAKISDENRKLLEVILRECGMRCGDDYIVLNNEHLDHRGIGANPFYNIATIIDRAFGCEDSLGEVFCDLDKEVIQRKVVGFVKVEEVLDKLMRLRLGTEKP